MPESFESERDAPFVCFDTNIFDRVERPHFEEVFFPKYPAMNVTDGNFSFVRFVNDFLPIRFALFDGASACPEFLDWEHF